MLAAAGDKGYNAGPMEDKDLPEQIHRYRILAELGRGSMGRVYLAEDPNIGRRLALKVLSPKNLMDSDHGRELEERFLVEARAAGHLDHPGIVTVHDADTDPHSGIPYLAMEYVEGISLHELLRGGRHLEVSEALQLTAQVARALHHAHRQKVIHRDIKPANLLVKHDGDGNIQAKVADFGIAKLVSSSLTQPGYVVGTPNYMAPEQVRGKTVDGRADLFALGAVLYECLTGRTAFGNKDIDKVHYNILSVDPPSPELHNPAVTPAVRTVVDLALAKDPAERFQTGDEMATALEAVLEEFTAALAGNGSLPGSATRQIPRASGHSTVRSQPAVTDMTSLRDPRLPVAVGGESAPRWWYAVASGAFALLAMFAFLVLEDAGEDRIAPPWRTVETPRFSPDEVSSTPALTLPRIPPPVPVTTEDGVNEVMDRVVDGVVDEVVDEVVDGVAEEAGEGTLAATDEDLLPFGEMSRSAEPASAEPTAVEPVPTEPAAAEPSTISSPPKLLPPAPSTLPPATTPLEIVLRSYHREAYLSAWIDGKKVLTQRLSMGRIRRLVGKEFRIPMQVPIGRRSLEFHFSGLLPRRMDAQKKIYHEFAVAPPRVLEVQVEDGELHLRFEAPEKN